MSQAPSIVASAPGKAMLIGEYAVLEGAPSIVTAVDVRAHAFRPRAGIDLAREASPFVAAASAAMGAAESDAPIVETVGFVTGRRKIGLGSSAAVTAAVMGQLHLETGAALDPLARETLLEGAQAAHRAAQQGRGSGADVAASVLGGTLSYCDGRATRLEWPSWLSVGFFDAGAPASTTAFISKVEAGKVRDGEAHATAMEQLSSASRAFHAAFCRTQSDDQGQAYKALKGSVELHLRGLTALQANSGAPILTPAIEAILTEAKALGLAAKPSGAGGGDLVVVFAPHPADLDHLAYRLRERAGIARVSGLRVHAEGLRSEKRPPLTSRLPGLFRQELRDRRERVGRLTGLNDADFEALEHGSLGHAGAEHMSENVLGIFELPMAVATNFRINGRDVLVPMCIEEASVVAAASNAAKMTRAGGGFVAHSDPPWMVAQVLLVAPDDDASSVTELRKTVLDAREQILALADEQHPRLVARGGGARELEVRELDARNVVVHVLVDCRDAMGANLLNTVAEACAPRLGALTGWTPRLRILSNLADRRASHVHAEVPVAALATGELSGIEVAHAIVEASRFAELDPYRATTHNKGIMNGIDAVVLATGNDWRAVEAAAHAYAARDGVYRPLATWRMQAGDPEVLVGELSVPMALGVVGGATRAHPGARMALEMLEQPNSTRLGQIAAAVGLASNLAALRALATEGIQRGHMSLHARAVALSAGAEGEELEILAKRLIDVGEIKRERALALLAEIRNPKK